MWCGTEKTELSSRRPGKRDFSRGKNKLEPISTLRTYTPVEIEDTISLGQEKKVISALYPVQLGYACLLVKKNNQ